MELVQELTFTATLKPPLPIGPGPIGTRMYYEVAGGAMIGEWLRGARLGGGRVTDDGSPVARFHPPVPRSRCRNPDSSSSQDRLTVRRSWQAPLPLPRSSVSPVLHGVSGSSSCTRSGPIVMVP
jgi:hypothetical protein